MQCRGEINSVCSVWGEINSVGGEINSVCSVGGGDSYIKTTWSLLEILKRNPKRYQDPVLWP